MPSPPQPTFRARTTPLLYTECQKAFTRLGTDQAKVINMLMEQWLHGPRSATTIEPASLFAHPRRRKDIWLNEALLTEVEKRAADDGLPVATWIAMLIQSALTAQPVMLDQEILALENQSRELAAIGRNLNQIARHLNSGYWSETSQDALLAINSVMDKIQTEIKKLRMESSALIRARRKAWGSDNVDA